MRATHEILDHTSEAVLRLRAGSLAGILAEAGRALAALELRGAPAVPAQGWREVEVRSTDDAALLVDWLNELIYLAERERWVASEFEVLEAVGGWVRARVRGVPVEEPPVFVKAATMGNLRLERRGAVLEGEVTLDV